MILYDPTCAPRKLLDPVLKRIRRQNFWHRTVHIGSCLRRKIGKELPKRIFRLTMDAWPDLPKMTSGIGKTGSSFRSTPEMDGNMHRGITRCAFISKDNEKAFRSIQGTKRRLPRGPGTFTWAWSRKDGRQPASSLNPGRNRRRKSCYGSRFLRPDSRD